MAEKINLNKNVSNKRTYEKTINTSFTELGIQSIQEQVDNQPTVQEFFQMYNELFYEIPEIGEINSHEYLASTSAEYIGIEQDTEETQALQNEIATLREELLESQQELIKLATDTSQNSLNSPTDKIGKKNLKNL